MEFRIFLWMILGGVFTSTVLIVAVFIIVNECLRRRSKSTKYATTSNNHTNSKYELSNSYKQTVQANIRPPLPPRNQFDTESLTNSYEDMPEIPLVEVETSSLQIPNHNPPTDTHPNFLDNHSASESYDDVDALQNVTNSYEDMAEIPLVEVETSSLQIPNHNPPTDTHTNFLDNHSASESYDDVDALQNVQGNYEEVASLPDYLEVDLPPFQSESDNGSENYDDVDQLHGKNEDYDDVG